MKTIRLLIASLLAFSAIGSMSVSAQSAPSATKQFSSTEIVQRPKRVPERPFIVLVRVSDAQGGSVVGREVELHYTLGDSKFGRIDGPQFATTNSQGVAAFELPGFDKVGYSPLNLIAVTVGDSFYSMSTSPLTRIAPFGSSVY